MSYIDILNPATGETLGVVEGKTEEEVLEAIQKARDTFPEWKALSLGERLKYIKKIRKHLVEHTDELVERIVSDTGKIPFEVLMTEIFTTIELIRYYEKHAPSILKTKKVPTPLIMYGRHSEIQYRPMGVIAIISHWNFPIQQALVPTICALLAGNTVLLKPSTITPLCGILVEEILLAADFPEGVVQVLHGGQEIVEQLIEIRPDKFYVTGNVASGKKIAQSAAEHLIPVELELGGKDPMIVFADADLERATSAAVWGAFSHTGQTSSSIERVYVEFSVYGVFLSKLKEKTENLRIGIDSNSDIGSMTCPEQLQVVQDQIVDAVSQGATILCGGNQPKEDTLHFEPTILVDVHPSMKIMQEETSGPVLTVIPFSDEEEVVRLANDIDYGLGCSIWTRDSKKAERISRQMNAGNITINDVILTYTNPHLSFGGIKQSGIGRIHGPEGLYTFCHTVSVISYKKGKANEFCWYPYNEDKMEALKKIIQILKGLKKPTVREIRDLYQKFIK